MDGPIVSKIYYNQEITVNYRPEEIRSSMKKKHGIRFQTLSKMDFKKDFFLKALSLGWKEMVFCYQNCSDLMWEKIALVIEKNFSSLRLNAKDLENFWNH